MEIRVGGERDNSVLTALRETGQAGRTRTPVSDEPRERRDAEASGVVIRLSPQARKALDAPQPESVATPTNPDEAKPGEAKPGEVKPGEAKPGEAKPGEAASGQKELTAEDRDTVRKLQARDAEVRQHEAAHMAAAGGHGSGASYDYQTGPDGRRYAVGGEVQVSIPSGGSPEEMIRNAQTMRAAALAPADPSSQDMAVASQAAQMEAQARQQKEVQRRENSPEARKAEAVEERKFQPRELVIGAGADDKDDKDDKTSAAAEAGEGTAAALETDPLTVFSALKSERMAVQGGNFSHPHSLSSCGFCSSAASKYV